MRGSTKVRILFAYLSGAQARSKSDAPNRGEGEAFELLVLIASQQDVGLTADYDTAIACRIEAIQVMIAAMATTRSGCLRNWESCIARAPVCVGASIIRNRLVDGYRRNTNRLDRAYFERSPSPGRAVQQFFARGHECGETSTFNPCQPSFSQGLPTLLVCHSMRQSGPIQRRQDPEKLIGRSDNDHRFAL